MGWHFCYIPNILTLKLGDTSSIKIFSQLCCMPTFLIIWPPACLPIQAWGDIWILLVSDWHPCPTLSRWSPRPICPIGRSLSQCQTLYITSLTLVNVSIRLITTMSTLNFSLYCIYQQETTPDIYYLLHAWGHTWCWAWSIWISFPFVTIVLLYFCPFVTFVDSL